AHHVASVNFHRRLGDADFVRDLLVEAAGRSLNHNLSLAGTEFLEPIPDLIEGLLTLATCAIARETGCDRIKKVLVTKRLGQELDSAFLHCPHRHRDVAMRGYEDDGKILVGRGKFSLQIEPTRSWH